MAEISASIVSYGGYEEVVQAAASILHYTSQPVDLYIIDNASPDGTGKKLERTRFEKPVTVICLSENVGFGKGHNTVLPRLKSKYHFVLNPDILVEEDTLTGMCAWMDEHPDVVMATPQLYFPTGEKQNLPRRVPNVASLVARQVPGFEPLQRFATHYTMQDEDLTKVQDIQFCTGSFFVIRTDVMKKIGGFDPDYFMYVEDADITRRAMCCGRVCLLPQFRAIHAWHREPFRRPAAFARQLSSMMLYFKKWGFHWC